MQLKKNSNNKLADKYRLLQAKQLIEQFRQTIVMDGQSVQVPVFVPSDSEAGAYRVNPLLEQSGTAKVEPTNG